MAAEATDIVSLNEIKSELRIGGDTDEERVALAGQDAMLTNQLKAAVSFIQEHTTLPLINRTQVCHVTPGVNDSVLCLPVRHVESVASIKYWSTNGALRAEPDQTIVVDSLGRRWQDDSGRFYLIWPPADGWPETLSNSLFVVTVNRDFEITAETEALKQAVVLLVRQLYAGYRGIRPTEAFFSLISPWRRYD